jgi:S-adenosylmethionine:tRNA ribosyltransferase-isomerase
MKDPRIISIQDYTYSLPEERIAKYPLAERDASKLLIYKEGKISEDIYCNISRHIPEDSLLIFNNTKVVEARLLFQKPTGGVIEIFCLEPHEQYADITTAMLKREKYCGIALSVAFPSGRKDNYWKKRSGIMKRK